MTIIGACVRMPHEYVRHFKSKLRVGKLADKYFSKTYADGLVNTYFEYGFSKISTDRGGRNFIGDIVIFIRKIEDGLVDIDSILDIEIDDFKHNKDKDDFRDYCLGSIGLDLKISPQQKKNMKVPVLRLPGDLTDIDDETIEQEIEQFFKKIKN